MTGRSWLKRAATAPPILQIRCPVACILPLLVYYVCVITFIVLFIIKHIVIIIIIIIMIMDLRDNSFSSMLVSPQTPCRTAIEERIGDFPL